MELWTYETTAGISYAPFCSAGVMMSYQLRKVQSSEDWRALHRIRRAVLFAPGRRSYDYDENHPDDRAAENTPFLLVSGDEVVGVARLDQHGTLGIVRHVAIAVDKQGMGLGRALGELLDAEARLAGITRLRASANADAVGYYEKIGWYQARRDRAKSTGLPARSVQMEKILRE